MYFFVGLGSVLHGDDEDDRDGSDLDLLVDAYPALLML